MKIADVLLIAIGIALLLATGEAYLNGAFSVAMLIGYSVLIYALFIHPRNWARDCDE